MKLEFTALVPSDEDYWTGNISFIANWLKSTLSFLRDQ